MRHEVRRIGSRAFAIVAPPATSGRCLSSPRLGKWYRTLRLAPHARICAGGDPRRRRVVRTAFDIPIAIGRLDMQRNIGADAIECVRNTLPQISDYNRISYVSTDEQPLSILIGFEH